MRHTVSLEEVITYTYRCWRIHCCQSIYNRIENVDWSNNSSGPAAPGLIMSCWQGSQVRTLLQQFPHGQTLHAAQWQLYTHARESIRTPTHTFSRSMVCNPPIHCLQLFTHLVLWKLWAALLHCVRSTRHSRFVCFCFVLFFPTYSFNKFICFIPQ